MKSIITKDLKTCAVCDSTYNVEVHHCIHGTSGRKLATQYHLLIGLCSECHRGTWGVHGNKEDITHLDLCLKQMAEKAFIKKYKSKEKWMEVFGKDYLAMDEIDFEKVKALIRNKRMNDEISQQKNH